MDLEGISAENLTKEFSFFLNHETTETQFLLSKKIVQPVSLAFLMSLILASLLEKLHISVIPESALVIFVGAILGAALRQTTHFPTSVLHELNAPIISMILLPIIIFESGWSLRKKDFASQFKYILIFAVFGTLLATTIVGTLIVLTGKYHGVTNIRTAFTFASLISATDPVATLATYSSLQVEPLLHIMVFGESTINDAVAIVLFDIMNDDNIFGSGGDQHLPPPAEMAKQIGFGVLQKLVGSILIGVSLAVIYTLLLRITSMRHSQSMMIMYIVFSCFFTFSTAEIMHCSGIIAVLFCGIFMSIYTRPSLNHHCDTLTSFFLKELAGMADNAVFLLVGLDTVLVNGTSCVLTLWVVAFCLVARACSTTVCGFLCNVFKRLGAAPEKKRDEQGNKIRNFQLSCKYLFMMWHAGLRGGIALMLVLEMGDWVDIVDGQGTKQKLINTTVLIVVIFLLVFGGTTEFALKRLGIPIGVETDPSYLFDRTLRDSTHHVMAKADEGLKKCLIPSEYIPSGNSSDDLSTVMRRSNELRHRWYRAHCHVKDGAQELTSDDEEESSGKSSGSSAEE